MAEKAKEAKEPKEGKKPAAVKKADKKAPAKKTAAKPKTEKIKEVEETAVKTEKPAAAEEPKAAKAGKRSAKALAEADVKAAKEERKQEETDEKSKPKPVHKPARSRLERRSKKYRKSSELVDKSKEYKLDEALDLACKTSVTKFDSTVELHVRLNVDPKQADQNIRDSVVLPSGSGKTVRVAVFADEANVKKAKAAGADMAGEDDLLALLDKGQIDFDILIAMPNMMIKLAKYARILGPKGLMPNPKSGTVTADVAKAVEQSKAGKIEYRVDGNGIVHCPVGKVSFGKEKLLLNAKALTASIKSNKPASVKSGYVKSVYVTTSMGPSVKVLLSEITA